MHTLKDTNLMIAGIVVLFLAISVVIAPAKVELIDTDTETLGNWVGRYGRNGAIIFLAQGGGVQHGGAAADEEIEGDIKHWDTGQGIRWCWEDPADVAGESALTSINDPDKRISGCAYVHQRDWTLTLEVDLPDYYVAGYFLSGEVAGGQGRAQQIWAYQGDERPKGTEAIEIRNFHFAHQGGEPRYYVWHVTGPEPFHIDFHHLAVNATISGIFIDAVLESVELDGRLTTTWASVKAHQ